MRAGKRPEIPPACPPVLSELMQKCWSGEPSERPSFEHVHTVLDNYFNSTYGANSSSHRSETVTSP